MAARASTALLGGYAATAAIATLAARLLPGTAVEATAWAMTVSFLLYAAIVLWAFAERRLMRVIATIWLAALVPAGIVAAIGLRP
ncbi:hypothetical protein [Sphingomonas montana]|uniref:hypothetical protein n=1 Tax=Sphingomonas montana TaxID=1843236 RepID=UPI00096E9ADD|nr:hypothetical protein [Sphingomonas montana]